MKTREVISYFSRGKWGILECDGELGTFLNKVTAIGSK
jgi:hypothetical protein